MNEEKIFIFNTNKPLSKMEVVLLVFKKKFVFLIKFKFVFIRKIFSIENIFHYTK